MSEKLNVKWNNFNRNLISTFGKLRGDKEFTDVTLTFEDGQQMEVHKVILAASSPFFENLLRATNHPHPLIYLKGFRSKDFLTILDFLYSGEANVCEEDLEHFLAIAQDIRLKGIVSQNSSDMNREEKPIHLEPKNSQSPESLMRSTTDREVVIPNLADMDASSIASETVTLPIQPITDLQALDVQVKLRMEKGQKMIPNGKHANGTPRQATSCICKDCGKEGLWSVIRDHIEANHLHTVALPCAFCSKTFSTRNTLNGHNSKFHNIDSKLHNIISKSHK